MLSLTRAGSEVRRGLIVTVDFGPSRVAADRDPASSLLELERHSAPAERAAGERAPDEQALAQLEQEARPHLNGGDRARRASRLGACSSSRHPGGRRAARRRRTGTPPRTGVSPAFTVTCGCGSGASIQPVRTTRLPVRDRVGGRDDGQQRPAARPHAVADVDGVDRRGADRERLLCELGGAERRVDDARAHRLLDADRVGGGRAEHARRRRRRPWAAPSSSRPCS